MKLTDEQKQFIQDNYQSMSFTKMAKALGLKWPWKVSQYCHANGLERERRTLSEADKNFIRNNYKSMREQDMCKVLGLKHRQLLQLFKREEGLARYAYNEAKIINRAKTGFFNVNQQECWVA